MDQETHQKLQKIFENLSEDKGGIDGVHFARLGKHIGKVLAMNSCARRLPVTVYDLVFAEIKPRGQRRIDFNDFMIGLDHLANRYAITIEEIINVVCSCVVEEPLDRSQKLAPKTLVGPERFFYDRNTYTGTHAYRQVMSGKEEEIPSGRVIDLSEIVNRERSSLPASCIIPRTPVPIHRVPDRTPQSVTVTSPGLGFRGSPATNTPSKGPERFYYDKTTYTGTHRFATPIKASPGILEDSPKEASARVITRRRFHDESELSQPTTAPVSGQPSPSPQMLISNIYPSYKPVEALNYTFAIPVEDYFTTFLRTSTDQAEM